MLQIPGSAGHKNKIEKECGNVAVLLHLLFSFFFKGRGKSCPYPIYWGHVRHVPDNQLLSGLAQVRYCVVDQFQQLSYNALRTIQLQLLPHTCNQNHTSGSSSDWKKREELLLASVPWDKISSIHGLFPFWPSLGLSRKSNRWSKFEGHGFESHPGHSFSLPLRGPIFLRRANAQVA